MSQQNKQNPHQNHRQRVYQRYLNEGLSGFAPHEVLELLLFYAIPRQDVNPLAHRLIDHFGSLSAVLEAHPSALAKVSGMSERSSILLSMMPQLLRRFEQDRLAERQQLSAWGDVKPYVQSLLSTHNKEVLYLICLDSKNRVIRSVSMGEGTVIGVTVPPRKVVETALLHNAAQVILAHNHPGGEALPSQEDLIYTRQLASAFTAIGIPLLDHIIVSGDEVYSFERNK